MCYLELPRVLDQQQIDQQNFTITEKHMHKANNYIFQKESYKIVGTFSKVQQ